MSEIKVNSVVNSTGDNDSGLDLSTNDQVIIKTANTTAVTVDSSQNATFANKLATTNLGTGAVLQVVQAETTTEVSTTGTSYIDTGITASITPSSTSNKILVTFSLQQFLASATGFSNIKLVRGTTDLNEHAYQGYAGSSTLMCQGTYQYLDTPSTTSSTTYKVQFKSNGSNVICQYDDANGDGVSSITLMEIAG